MKARFADAADADVEGIVEYGRQEFGRHTAMAYVDGLLDACDHIAEMPGLGRARNELQAGLRSFPYRSHMIFYILLPGGGIEIAGILHQRQDVTEAFDDPA